MNAPLYQRPELAPGPTVDVVCLGVMCEKHASCLRYHAVEFSLSNVVRMGFCNPQRTLFIPIRSAK